MPNDWPPPNPGPPPPPQGDDGPPRFCAWVYVRLCDQCGHRLAWRDQYFVTRCRACDPPVPQRWAPVPPAPKLPSEGGLPLRLASGPGSPKTNPGFSWSSYDPGYNICMATRKTVELKLSFRDARRVMWLIEQERDRAEPAMRSYWGQLGDDLAGQVRLSKPDPGQEAQEQAGQ